MKKTDNFFYKRIEPLILPVIFAIIIITLIYSFCTRHRRALENELQNGFGITFLNMTDEDLSGFHLGYFTPDGTSYNELMQTNTDIHLKNGNFETITIGEESVPGIIGCCVSVEIGVYPYRADKSALGICPLGIGENTASWGRGAVLHTDVGDINVIAIYGSSDGGFTMTLGTPEDFGIDIYKPNS